MKYTLMIGLGLMTLASTELSAGILGKYKVKGSEFFYGSKYSFRGTATVTSYTTCTVKLGFSDGDSATIRGKFKTPLKETKQKQTVQCAWSGEGMTGSGKVTISGNSSAYSLNFTFKGAGVSGSGTGSKSL